jgi:hypothetical protein
LLNYFYDQGAVEEPKQGFNFRNLDWEKINQAIAENPDNSDDDNHLEDWDKPRQHTAEELAELEPKTGDGGSFFIFFFQIHDAQLSV